MSMTKDTTTTGPPSTSTWTTCFRGCFGCNSGEKTQLKDEVNSVRRRHRSSKWSLMFKKSPTKTVPVDLTAVPLKNKSAKDPPTTSGPSLEIQEIRNHDNGNHGPVTSGEQKTNGKKRTAADGSRQKETKPTGKQKTVTIVNSSVSSPLKPLTYSKSLPPAIRQKRPPARSGVNGKQPDSIIGLSIILVILVILVLWGRLCAILCTCSWLFIVPRLVAAGELSGVDKLPAGGHNNVDLESVEYKKKVVLEGLLQRNRRNVVAGL